MSREADQASEPEEVSDAAAEFAAMRRKLALVLAAQEGFAARLQELHSRDYSDDLSKIQAQQEVTSRALTAFADTPAMQVSLSDVTAGIKRAGATIRAEEQQALIDARREFVHAAQDVQQVVASAREAEVQRKWLMGATAGGMILGMFLFAVLPGAIARSMPESWLWPEQRAIKAMGLDGWQAGNRLLQVSDPDRWEAQRQAIMLMKANEQAIAECWGRSLKRKGAVRCSIEVDAEAK